MAAKKQQPQPVSIEDETPAEVDFQQVYDEAMRAEHDRLMAMESQFPAPPESEVLDAAEGDPAEE